jgi:hypothetical protein
MAKSSSGAKVTGTSRIRFIMLDAELANSDLTQVTQAIQNALRPSAIAPQSIISKQLPGNGTTASNPEATPDESTLEVDDSQARSEL